MSDIIKMVKASYVVKHNPILIQEIKINEEDEKLD